MNWFLPVILFTSLSVRTPNVIPNPSDYEISVGMEKPGVLFFSRQQERELGVHYVDEVYWAATTVGPVWLREKYFSKTSKGIVYNQIEARYVRKGFGMGYALRTEGERHSHRLVAGYLLDRRFNFVVASGQFTVDLEATSGLGGEVDYAVRSKVALDLGAVFSAYVSLTSERACGRYDYWFKTGIQAELPGRK